MNSPAPPSHRRRHWWPLAALAALCLGHVLFNAWWLGADNHVIRGDEESHMEYARAYYEVFSLNDYSNVVQRIVALGNIRPKTMSHPPLLHILGGLQLSVFGYSVDGLSFTNTYSLVAAIIGVYLLARRMLPSPAALFCASVFSATPIVFTASRFFMTDFLAMAITVWAVYALLQSEGFRHTGWVLLFAMLNGLGLLSRSVNFLYLLAPAAVVFAWGLWRCRPAQGEGVYWRGVQRLAVHGAMSIIVTLGIAVPWYFRHADSIYDFWVTYRGGVTGTPLAGLDEALVPEKAPAPPKPKPEAQPAAPAAPAAAPTPEAKPNIVVRVLKRFLYPPNPWIDYPVHLINNALFLPLSLLSLGGLLLAWLPRRFRRLDTLVLLAWVVGSLVLMQMTLRWSTPRYTMQFVPALSLFAALGILSLPRRARQIAVPTVLALLALQYLNMTVYSPPPLRQAELPVVLSEEVQQKYHDPGLALIKDNVSASNAYRRMGTPETYNYKDEVFGALVRAETTGPPRAGEYANYARLRMLGMEWDERHYWPEPNPYLLQGTDPAILPRRKLHSIAMGNEPNHLKPYVNSVDYIVYRAYSEAQEAEWTRYFSEYGFAPIHRYQEPAIGADPPGFYGVLQKGGGTQIDLSDTGAVSALDVYDLHTLIQTPAFAQAKSEVQEAARQRYKHLLEQFRPFELTSQVSILNADVIDLGGGIFRMRYLLKVTQEMERDVGIYLIGRVAPEHYGLLPAEVRAANKDYFTWHLHPSPPTSQWKKGGVQLIYQDFTPQPIPHALMMGLESFDGDLVGRGVDLGAVNFENIKVPVAVAN